MIFLAKKNLFNRTHFSCLVSVWCTYVTYLSHVACHETVSIDWEQRHLSSWDVVNSRPYQRKTGLSPCRTIDFRFGNGSTRAYHWRFLIVWGNWPAIFWVNFPFIILSFLLGWYMFPKDIKQNKAHMKKLFSNLDFLGIGYFAAGMVFFLWFLLSFEGKIHYLSGVVGIIFFGLFVLRELRVKEPFIDIRIFKTHPKLSMVYIQFIFLNIFFYCLFFGLPSYFQEGLGLSVEMSGLLMLFMSGISIIISSITGKWIDRQV